MSFSFRKFWQHLKAHPRQGVVLCVGIIAIVAIWPAGAHAQALSALGNGVVSIVSWFLTIILNVLGSLLIKFIDILVWIAQYNDFINAPAVQTGWAVTRDVANMFFIVALLLISIGTVFQIQEYRYTSMLRKLIMMAILINFSKTIAAFFIDLSQVVMLTFVNAFKDMAAGNLTKGFGIDKIVSFSQDISAQGGDINPLSVLGSVFVAVVMLFIALVVVGIFVVLLAQRIVMLWIYIVLAPTAYMVAVLPGSLGSWWGSWWRDFSNQLIKGPVIAFFLWLALTVISFSNTTILPDVQIKDTIASQQTGAQDKPVFAGAATTTASIINYIVAVGMLVAGLQQATKAGGVAGNVAGKWMGNINRLGAAGAMAPFNIAKKLGGFAGGRAADLVKPTAYRVGEGALGLASKMNFLGIQGAARKQQAVLRQQRMKSEDKDAASAKFLEGQGERDILLGNPATLSGRGYQKAAMENAMKTHGLAGYSNEEKMQILSAYEAHIGYSKKPKVGGEPGEFTESAIDSDGLKGRKDLFKKSPGLLAVRASSSTGDERTFYENKLRDQIKSMSFADFNDMQKSDWDDPVMKSVGLPVLDERLRNDKYKSKFDSDVNQSMQEAIDNARGGATRGSRYTDDEVLAQEDIDHQRQQRTEALRTQHGEEFEKSAEYIADPSKYYSKQQYQQNARQQQRVLDRLAAGKAGASEITSLGKFNSGKSNTLAVSEGLLNQAGVKATAGGYTRNPESIKRIAGVLNQQIQGDVDSIESELAELTQQEKQLQTPAGKLLDASGRPMTPAQADPEKLKDIEAQRAALQTRKNTLRATQARLQDPSKLEDITFINADRSGGAARNILAEEAMHKQLDAMDDDGSIRAAMKSQFTPEEFQEIVADQRNRSDNAGMSEDRAFDEYLAKGLVNQGRWADTSPDAVKLKSGLALALKAKAEAKGVDLKLTAKDEAALEDVVVPPAAGAGRKLRADAGEAWQGVKNFVGAPLQRRREDEKVRDEQRERILQSQKVMDTSVKKDEFQAAQQEQAKAEQEYANIRKQKDAKLKSLQDNYAKNEAAYNDRTKSKAERDNAYTLMGAYRNDIAKEQAELEPTRAKAEAARKNTAEKQAALQQAVATKEESTQSQRTVKTSTRAAGRTRGTGDIIEEPDVTAANVTNITNVTQNIQQVFKSAPPEIRGKLTGITADVLDSALKNSIVWRGLMSYIKNNAAEIQKSEKLSDLGRSEIQKHIGSMEKHVRDGNAEEFKSEFGSLQNMFSGTGGGSDENI